MIILILQKYDININYNLFYCYISFFYNNCISLLKILFTSVYLIDYN